MRLTEILMDVDGTDEAFQAGRKFGADTGKKVKLWVGENGKLCIIALPIDGGVYARELWAVLKKLLPQTPELIYMSLDGGGLEKGEIGKLLRDGFLFLLVDNDTVTGKTAMTVRTFLLEVGVPSERIKLAVYTDRVGVADYYCEMFEPLCYRCGKHFKKYSEKLLHLSYCEDCLTVARVDVSMIKRAFKDINNREAPLEELAERVNSQKANNWFSLKRVREYLENPILFEKVEKDVYRLRT